MTRPHTRGGGVMTKKPKPKNVNWLWVKMQIEKERLEKKPLHKGR